MANKPTRRVIGRASENEPLVAQNPSTRRPLRQRSSARGPEVSANSGDQLAAPKKSAKRKKRIVIGVSVFLTIVVILPLFVFIFGWWQFSKIDRVNVESVLSPRAGRKGTNYLIVGTDSREGVVEIDADAAVFGEASGARTDSIMVLHLDGSSSQLLSIPRDLWITDPATGKKGRINATFAAGPDNLIRAVESIGIPVDHFIEINFVSFAKLVDAVGGITVDFPAPARDTHSGLSIPKAGPQKLNGAQALAYVRSRYYEQFENGKWKIDPTSDLGRAARQRQFLTTLLGSLSSVRNPLTAMRIPSSLGTGMKIDTTISYFDALGLVWTMRSQKPASEVLPVTPRTTSGGASVVDLKPEAKSVIAGVSN